MTTKPTLFIHTPGTILEYQPLEHAAAAIEPLFASLPSLHFVIVPHPQYTVFFIMSFATWRHLPTAHPALGMLPLFSGTLTQLRTLAKALPPLLPLQEPDAPNT